MNRNQQIIEFRQSGWKLLRIAVRFGISKQRVHQILNRDEFNRARQLWRAAK